MCSPFSSAHYYESRDNTVNALEEGQQSYVLFYCKRSLNKIADLFAQNEKQSNRIAEQSAEILVLMKSYERESHLAIRRLLDDTERCKDKSVFSRDAQDFLSQQASQSRRCGDRAVHAGYSVGRIREAVIQYKKPKTKAILIDLFTKCYGEPIVEEDDDYLITDVDD